MRKCIPQILVAILALALPLLVFSLGSCTLGGSNREFDVYIHDRWYSHGNIRYLVTLSAIDRSRMSATVARRVHSDGVGLTFATEPLTSDGLLHGIATDRLWGDEIAFPNRYAVFSEDQIVFAGPTGIERYAIDERGRSALVERTVVAVKDSNSFCRQASAQLQAGVFISRPEGGQCVVRDTKTGLLVDDPWLVAAVESVYPFAGGEVCSIGVSADRQIVANIGVYRDKQTRASSVDQGRMLHNGNGQRVYIARPSLTVLQYVVPDIQTRNSARSADGLISMGRSIAFLYVGKGSIAIANDQGSVQRQIVLSDANGWCESDRVNYQWVEESQCLVLFNVSPADCVSRKPLLERVEFWDVENNAVKERMVCLRDWISPADSHGSRAIRSWSELSESGR